MTREIPLRLTDTAESIRMPDLDAARRGAQIFGQVLHEASPSLRKYMLGYPFLQATFVGVSAESTIHTRGLLEEFDSLLTPYIEDYKLIPHRRDDARFSIINIAQASRIMDLHPAVFPSEASVEPTEWLERNTLLWHRRAVGLDFQTADLIHTRYGLLSGYPYRSASRFLRYSHAQERLEREIHPQELSEVLVANGYDVRDLPVVEPKGPYHIPGSFYNGYLKYFHKGTDRNAFDKALMQNELSKYREFLSGDVIELLSSGLYVSSPYLTYIGFEPDADGAFIQSVNDTMTKSGLLEIVR